MKKLTIVIILIILVLISFRIFKKDVWSGYFYPDRNNLSNWIEAERTFDSLGECRDWAEDTAFELDSENGMYDYECGLNCKYKNGFNVCEETLN